MCLQLISRCIDFPVFPFLLNAGLVDVNLSLAGSQGAIFCTGSKDTHWELKRYQQAEMVSQEEKSERGGNFGPPH